MTSRRGPIPIPSAAGTTTRKRGIIAGICRYKVSEMSGVGMEERYEAKQGEEEYEGAGDDSE